MAFSSAILGRDVSGERAITFGSFTNGAADIGGDIATGLKSVDFIELIVKGTTTASLSAVVNETFPLASGSVTIVCADGTDGYWKAYGRA